MSASISTPVRPSVRTRASMRRRDPAAGASSTAAAAMGRGWHMGTSSLVRLAAWMPATRATASTSPLGRPPRWMSASVSARMATKPSATASRAVTALPETSTMRAAPRSSRWESPPAPSPPAMRPV